MRERLLRAAHEMFLEEGYRACIDSIALRAGVAKQTLYNHFASKDELFGEVARRATQSILISLEGETGDICASLVRFAHAYRLKALSDEGVAAYRMLTAEAQRFDKSARAIYENGPGETARQLAAFLMQAMNAGLLRRDDPDFAAEMLIGMLVGKERTRSLLGVQETNEPAADKAERIVDCFLRAYASQGINE